MATSPAPRRRRYLVPTFDAEWEQIEEALAELGAEELEPDEGCERDWAIGDADETLVHLYTDTGLDLEHLVVEGANHDEVARHLRERVPTFSPEDMPRLFADPDVDLDDKLAVLAAGAPATADPTFLDLFRRGFDHDDPLVREQAVLVSTVPAWPELRALVERLAREDGDPDVRQSAEIALRDFDAAARRE